jgi:hypothetical protein
MMERSVPRECATFELIVVRNRHRRRAAVRHFLHHDVAASLPHLCKTMLAKNAADVRA